MMSADEIDLDSVDSRQTLLSVSTLSSLRRSNTSVVIRTEKKKRKRKKKIQDEYDKVLNVIDTLFELYDEGRLRKEYKERLRTSVFYKYSKRLIAEREQTEGQEKGKVRYEGWQLEKETIDNLDKMMTEPKYLKNTCFVLHEPLDDLKLVTHDYEIIRGYLDRFYEGGGNASGDGKFQLTETEEGMLSHPENIYDLDADNIFTNKEMEIIKWRKATLRREIILSRKLKKKEKKLKPTRKLEMWEWDEFFEKYEDVTDDSSSISNYQPVTIGTDHISQRMKHHLKNWLDREYPSSERVGAKHRFHFFGKTKYDYIRKRSFETDEKRLEVSLRFVRLGQIAYPGIDVNLILSDLESYFGKEEIPTISKRDTVERDLMNSEETDKMKLLKKMKTRNKKSTRVKKYIKTIRKEENKHFLLERIRYLTNVYHLGSLYNKFHQAKLPTPYGSLYTNMINGLFKIYNEIYAIGKLDKDMILDFLRDLSRLIFDCVQWLIESLFRSHVWQDIEKHGNIPTEQCHLGKNFKEKEGPLDEIRKEMARVIKYQKLHFIVEEMINPKHENISSSDLSTKELKEILRNKY